MQSLALMETTQVEWLDVRVTPMINKPRLVAVEHAVEAEREKLAPVAF